MRNLTSKPGHIATASLPHDMRVFVSQVLEEQAGIAEMPTFLPVREIPVAWFPDVPLQMACGDERGIEYAMDMVGQDLPPLVLIGDVMIDGRHRLHAARHEGKLTLLAIDLSTWIPEAKVPDYLALGSLKVRSADIANDLAAMKLAQQFIDAAPERVMSAGEYRWEFRDLTAEELEKTGLRENFRQHAKSIGLDSQKSDLSRPVIVSCGDDGVHEVALWDGVHRILSAFTRGMVLIPAAVGVRLDLAAAQEGPSEAMDHGRKAGCMSPL